MAAQSVMQSVTIPTREIWLCPSCEVVTNLSSWCPLCCGTTMLNLAKILHPEKEEKE